MKNFNLTEAAKDILSNNVASKQGGQEHGVGDTKLPTSVAYGQKDAGLVGHSPETMDDENPDYLKGTPTATPPGAKPPVGSEPKKVLASQPQQTQGRSDLTSTMQAGANIYDKIRDRVASKLATQTMQSNPGATFQSYSEEFDDGAEQIDELSTKTLRSYASKAGSERHPESYYNLHKKGKSDKSDTRRDGWNTALDKIEKGAGYNSRVKVAASEEIEAILSGENLSEEFKAKAATIFEAAVVDRASDIIAEAEMEMVEQFDLAVEQIKEEMAEKIDGYLNYMVEEWVKENELAIVSGLRAEIAESFIDGLRNLFSEHYIDIPEEKVDIIEELTSKIESLESDLNEQIICSVELNKELNEHKKYEAIYAACDGLTQTQVEKLKSLAESVDFTTEEEFNDKIETIKESYLVKSDVKFADSYALDDEVLIEEAPTSKGGYVDPDVAIYAKTISQTLIK